MIKETHTANQMQALDVAIWKFASETMADI